MQLKYVEYAKVDQDARTPPLHTSFTGNIYLEDGSRVSLIGTQMSGEIIRAVNCHDALLEACKRSLILLDMLVSPPRAEENGSTRDLIITAIAKAEATDAA